MCLSPMIPHVTHELWRQLGHETALINERWWAPDQQALVQDAIEISVQVGGKMRARVQIPVDADQDAAVKVANGQKIPQFTYMQPPVVTKSNVQKFQCHW